MFSVSYNNDRLIALEKILGVKLGILMDLKLFFSENEPME